MNEMIPGLWMAGDILIAIAGTVSWLFVLMYRRLDWRASAIGKFLMRFVALAAVVFTYAVVSSHVEIDRFWHAIIRLVLYTGIVIELSLLNTILLSYEKKNREKSDKEKKEFYHGG